jgi:uncharacterized protein (TIRG00374 family)
VLGWLLPWGAVVLLLWLTLRRLDFSSILDSLALLSIPEIGILLLVNAGVVGALSCRWWIILRSLGTRLPYAMLSLFRLAGFGVSYFTPGSQFGGEPLLVELLRRQQVSGSKATASVALDKTMEVVVNFAFLLFGLGVVLRMEVLPLEVMLPVLGLVVLLVIAPILLVYLASRGAKPLRWLASRLPGSLRRRWNIQSWPELLRDTEFQMMEFLRGRPRYFWAALLASLASWVLLLWEYWLMAQYLGLGLSLGEAIAVLTAARIAILMPVPGGLGTLEASQAWALASLGGAAESGLALALVIRGRDIIFGSVGLTIGSLSLSRGQATED